MPKRTLNAFERLSIMVGVRIVFLIAALLLAACSGAVSEPERGPSESVSSSGPGRKAEGRAPTSVRASTNRVLVQTEDGHLFTVLPDGTERVVLSEPPQLLSARQATWSPDASRVPWVVIDGRTAPAMSVVVTAKADGSQQALAVTSAPAFFLNWDPTGSRVAYLGPGPDGIELGLVDHVVGGSVAAVLEGGQPFYFSWAPEGDRMFSLWCLKIASALPRCLDRRSLRAEARRCGSIGGSF